jgi:branched-chain amino acid transport system substrate-binding protein
MNRRAFLAASATSATLPALAFAAQPKEKVKIVSSLPRTGSAKELTLQIVNAIKMAIADFQKELPVAVSYEDWDDATPKLGQWDKEAEIANAEKAVADKSVLAYIGPYNSGAARESIPILNKAGLIQITPTASWPGLTKNVPGADPDEPERYRPAKRITFCRTCPHDGSQAPLSVDFVADELKVKSVYIVDDKELYGHSIATAFKQTCQARKITVHGHDNLNATVSDFKATLKKIKEKEPELIYLGSTTYSGAPRFAKALHSEKISVPLLLPDGCYEDAFVKAVGEKIFDELKCFVTIGGISPSRMKDRGAEFVKRYKEQHKVDANPYALYGYDAAAVVLEAFRKVGKNDREAIRKAVTTTKDFDKGVLGKWSFDADGDTTQQALTITTIEKGKFRTVKVLGIS